MNADPANLFRALASGIQRPSAATPTPALTIDSLDFATLLQQARDAEIETGLPISVGRGVEASLSDDQLQHLALLADRAEADGVTTALVLSSGDAYLLDVHSRTITEKVDPESSVVHGVDGVLRLDLAAERGATRSGAFTSPPQSLSNASLMDLLSRLSTSPHHAEQQPSTDLA